MKRLNDLAWTLLVAALIASLVIAEHRNAIMHRNSIQDRDRTVRVLQQVERDMARFHAKD